MPGRQLKILESNFSFVSLLYLISIASNLNLFTALDNIAAIKEIIFHLTFYHFKMSFLSFMN